jgi:hypothetical protein
MRAKSPPAAKSTADHAGKFASESNTGQIERPFLSPSQHSFKTVRHGLEFSAFPTGRILVTFSASGTALQCRWSG